MHEPPALPAVEHLHGDPHFAESIEATIGDRTFDVVLAMYGRLRLLAAGLAGRCDRFLAIGGTPVYAGFFKIDTVRLPIPVTEDHPVVHDESDEPSLKFARRLADAERTVFAHHPGATVLRFPMIYGPNNARPHEWSVVRRVRDRRPHMIIPDGGFQVHSRCAAQNAAGFVLAAVDHPVEAEGQVYNCADPINWSLREWAETIVNLMGGDLEMVAIPSEIAVDAASTLLPLANTPTPHCILSIEKAKRDLGYRTVIQPIDALRAVLEWYESKPDFDVSSSPSMTDRFDYATEDALIERYRRAVRQVLDDVPQEAAPPVHSMPHPTTPGEVDHRGR
jgi:nucleoside-diphosphate-sugar epimerase